MGNYDPEQYWQIDDVVANELIGTVPTYSIGEKTRLKFGFAPLSGESEEDYATRVHRLRERAKHAGAYVYHETLGGTAAYTEQHNDDTLLTAIRSPSGQPVNYNAWVLLQKIDSIQTGRQHNDGIRLTVDYLADFDEYQNKREVEHDLKSQGI